jgi:hypothetical protein
LLNILVLLIYIIISYTSALCVFIDQLEIRFCIHHFNGSFSFVLFGHFPSQREGIVELIFYNYKQIYQDIVVNEFIFLIEYGFVEVRITSSHCWGFKGIVCAGFFKFSSLFFCLGTIQFEYFNGCIDLLFFVLFES